MLSRSADSIMKGFRFLIKFHPISLVYATGTHRRILYKVATIYAFVYIFDLFRLPYLNKKLLEKTQLQQQTQEEGVASILQKIDVKLSDFNENYFVIITATSNIDKQEQLAQNQRIIFELNNILNKKLQIHNQIFSDIKFLFVGSQELYKIAQVNNTIIQFHEKQTQKRQHSGIYILARQNDNQQRLIHAGLLKSEIRSILNVISKHRARKFASSMQF